MGQTMVELGNISTLSLWTQETKKHDLSKGITYEPLILQSLTCYKPWVEPGPSNLFLKNVKIS